MARAAGCWAPAGAAHPPAPVVLTVTGARLALLPLEATLVPVYVFELDGGGEAPPVPAVTDEWLDNPGSVQR
ncbi:MAG: hypothetical protein M3Q48_14260 [Actinomycetota bacterium]|nr:hypothetical protein [Actinomycetota bacterium]